METRTYAVDFVSGFMVHGMEKNTPECRAPSIRGLLRFWLRAVAGGLVGGGDIDGLNRVESYVFGSSDSGSKLKVVVIPGPQPLKAGRFKVVPVVDQRGDAAGFNAAQSFKLQVTTLYDPELLIINAADAIFRLSIALGGFGLRARRGYGALRLSGEILANPDEWEQSIRKVTGDAIASVRAVAKKFDQRMIPLSDGPSRFPCINKLAKIYLGDQCEKTADAVMTQFMTGLQERAWLGSARGGRQASPLWVKPVKIGAAYFPQYTILASDFNGSDYEKLNHLLTEKGLGRSLEIEGWNK